MFILVPLDHMKNSAQWAMMTRTLCVTAGYNHKIIKTIILEVLFICSS